MPIGFSRKKSIDNFAKDAYTTTVISFAHILFVLFMSYNNNMEDEIKKKAEKEAEKIWKEKFIQMLI